MGIDPCRVSPSTLKAFKTIWFGLSAAAAHGEAKQS
jgi:hypothetical protein